MPRGFPNTRVCLKSCLLATLVPEDGDADSSAWAVAGCVTARASVLGMSAVHVCVHGFPVSVCLNMRVPVCLSVFVYISVSVSL